MLSTIFSKIRVLFWWTTDSCCFDKVLLPPFSRIYHTLMTFLLETIRLGLTSLRLHLLRSILTALGIILGVASVIVMSSLGEGSTREALAQIEALGARNIIIRSQKPPETQNQQQGNRAGWITRFGLTRQDFENIQFQFPDAEYIVPVKSIGSQILRNEKRITSQAFGTTPQLRNVANLAFANEQNRFASFQKKRSSRASISTSQFVKIYK